MLFLRNELHKQPKSERGMDRSGYGGLRGGTGNGVLSGVCLSARLSILPTSFRL